MTTSILLLCIWAFDRGTLGLRVLSNTRNIRQAEVMYNGIHLVDTRNKDYYNQCKFESGTNLAFDNQSMRCYELNTRGPCGENMMFYRRWHFPNVGDCFCDKTQPYVYKSSTQKCHMIFNQDHCLGGYWLQLNEYGNLECYPNPCYTNQVNGNNGNDQNFVLFNGVCARLGEDCGNSKIIGFYNGSFEPECGEGEEGESIVAKPAVTITPTFCENDTEWSVLEQKCIQINDESFRLVGLVSTNEYRVNHRATPLVEDENLNQIAQLYASKLARENTFEHSRDRMYGENLYYYKGPMKSNSELVLDAIIAWYDEVKYYDYNLPLFSNDTAHFTQLIWNSTERQGVGVATNPTTNYNVVVVNYFPPGNWEGEFFENVRRPYNTIESEIESETFTIY